MKNLYFIMVNYNNNKLTRNFCMNIEKLSNGRVSEIIVVDNNSELYDFKELSSLSKENSLVNIIRSDKNLGYFGGLNLGLEYIKDKKNSIVVICNNDLILHDNFIDNLINKQYDEETFVICPDVITIDGIHQNPEYINKIPRYKKFLFSLYFSNYYMSILMKKVSNKVKKMKYSKKINAYKLEEQYIHQGIGACYILTENFFNKFDRLKNEVFLWGEEVLLTHQVQLEGGKILFSPSLKVDHLESQSVSKIQSRESHKLGKEAFKIYKKYI